MLKQILIIITFFTVSQISLLSSEMKWDTLDTEFDYFNFRSGDPRSRMHTNEEFIFNYDLGIKIGQNLIISQYYLFKKDLTEYINFQLDYEYNTNNYLPFDCKITDDNVIHVVADSGYIFQKNIYETDWTSKKIIDESSYINSVAFRDNDYAIITNIPDRSFITIELFFTKDGGMNWEMLENQLNIEDEHIVTDLNFYQDTLLVFVYEYNTKNNILYTSFNSGINWDRINIIPTNKFMRNRAKYFKDGKLWIYNQEIDGFIFTDDFGDTWSQMKQDNNVSIRGITNITFKDDLSEGFATTPYGVYHTTDWYNWKFYRNHEDLQLANLNLMVYNYENEIYLIQDSAALKYDGIPSSVKTSTTDNSISVFPNPFYENVTISFPEFMRGEAKIEIYNSVGVLIEEGNFTIAGGEMHFTPDADVPGVYFYRITHGTEIYQGNFVKME
jgi:photosystem II stability/assembly factor-like uncharacterized protein